MSLSAPAYLPNDVRTDVNVRATPAKPTKVG